ncbi:origin recognition complex subunit 1 [Nematocida sp. LUAm3]|nr:origin recognition complex subunit 1 [Nematocida sp. LUAm3]KAI5173663.1 origin recognition complex subunit 1 [Nematocida sp. LUAm2]KAI5176884.1 origin recognition complex subunit 1 [Nematocida sp. LUAm1]
MRTVPLGREEETSSMYRSIEEAVQKRVHGILYISGMPGCGKTLTSHKVIEVLEEKFPFITTVSINCGTLVLPSDIFLEIGRSLDASISNSSPRIVEEALKHKEYTILLVDEIDMLITRGQRLLYSLLELASLSKNVYIIAISNTYNLPDKRLTSKVRSRLGWNRINFPMYKKIHVIGIIKESFRNALTKGATEHVTEQKGATEHVTESERATEHKGVTFTEDAVEYCATKICALNGDIRKAFQIQKYAVEYAKTHQLVEIGVEEVDKAIRYVYHSMKTSFIRALPKYQRILLEIVSKKGYSYPNEIYEELKAILSLKSLPSLPYKEFESLLIKMHISGVLKGRVNSPAVESDYIPEEIDAIFTSPHNEEIEILSID